MGNKEMRQKLERKNTQPPRVCATQASILQGLISPFKAKAEMRMHNPKDKGERTSISLDVKTSSVEARPSFGQMPLFHSIIRLVMSSLSAGIIVSAPPLPSFSCTLYYLPDVI